MQMGSDVFLALGQIKRWQGALDVDALFYGSVGWLYKLIPKLVLSNEISAIGFMESMRQLSMKRISSSVSRFKR